MMHTYRRIGGVFEVGYYRRDFNERDSIPVDRWVSLSTHTNETLAIKRVNALNGGPGDPHWLSLQLAELT